MKMQHLIPTQNKNPATKPFTCRDYQDEHDVQSMLDMLMLARSQTNDWRYAHVGELLFNYFMVACHLNPARHIHLWHDAVGNLVAYAILGEDPSIDWQVLPAYEWAGIEAEVFNWAESTLAYLRQCDPIQWKAGLVSGSRQDDPQRIGFLGQHGFKYCGSFAEVNLLRSLSEPIPIGEIPPGFQLTSMAEWKDIADRAAAHREVWQSWTVGNISTGDYDRFMQLPGYHPDLDVITVSPGGVVAAYVNGWIDPVNHIGDFGPVGAREAFRRQGCTRIALLESLRRMRDYGMDRVCISTGINNTPALNLYSSVGFKAVNRYLDYVQVSRA